MADRSIDATMIQKWRAYGDQSHWPGSNRSLRFPQTYPCLWVLPPNNVTGMYELGIRHTRIYGCDQRVQWILTCRKDALFVIYFHQDPNQFHHQSCSITGRSSRHSAVLAGVGRSELGFKDTKCFLTGIITHGSYQSGNRYLFSPTLGRSEEAGGTPTAERVVDDG